VEGQILPEHKHSQAKVIAEYDHHSYTQSGKARIVSPHNQDTMPNVDTVGELVGGLDGKDDIEEASRKALREKSSKNW